MLRAFLPHLPARRKKQFFLLVLLMFAGALAELVTLGAVIPFVALMAEPERAYDFPKLQQLFSNLGWEQSEALIIPMTMLFLAIVVTSAAIRLLLAWVKNRYTFALGYDIGVALYSRVLNQPYRFHISRNTSETIAAVNKVQMAVNGVLSPIMEAMIGVIIGVAIITALIIINPTVALSAAVIFGFFYLVVTRLMRIRLRRNSKIIAEAQTARVRAVQEGLGGIRDVLLDNSQDFYVKHFSRVDRRLRTAQSTNAFIGQAPRYIIEAMGIVLIVGLAYYLAASPGGLMAALPTLGALALGAQRLLPLLQQIYNGWSRILGNRQVFADVLELLSLPKPVRGSSDVDNKLELRHAIELRNLRFRYADNEPWVLAGLDLTIPKGARTGIAGKTGSGKTTAMDIVMGLLQPSHGEILVDGIEVTRENRRAWQNQIAHVPQFIYLADASIAENIAFGLPTNQVDMGKVRDAARRAQIADFIESTREGYEARVGERGIQLSGGQRQRIGIARALYKNAEVLVFDEATSALDQDTEASVMDCINELDADLTIFIIAHRLQTLRYCNRVIKLKNGQIAASGTYTEIIEDVDIESQQGFNKGSEVNVEQ